ncbi:hypothetical protein SKAU_G00164350 [Synaphobranchus kaupii]|uniref:non-specific serine/threonine protein kinase n=1 Tax=Synaphobranchus kaupii TaxID=118154 RepID=A0A9Q1J026_SYNKA|nr:hypothetical protein SKAU_G00164350 [Synaphobranchus kaupii]
MIRGPEFLVRLRSHIVFENTSVKLFCTVHGYPTPNVKWFKDNVLLDTSTVAKYFVESNYGIHSLEIIRCSTDDTAQYTAVATNLHGQVSSQAAVIVKRFREEDESCVYAWLPYQCKFSTTVDTELSQLDTAGHNNNQCNNTLRKGWH